MTINEILIKKLGECTRSLKGYNNPSKGYHVHNLFTIDVSNKKLKRCGFHIVDMKQKLIFMVDNLSKDAEIKEIMYDESYIDAYISSIYQCDTLASFAMEPMLDEYAFYIESDKLFLPFFPGKKFTFQSEEQYYRDLKLKQLGV